jgi:hypothetical protein
VIRGWQDRDPRVREAIRNMPTKKTASLEKLKVYIVFMTQRMDVMLEFSQFKPFRRLRLRSFIFMKKILRQLCERLVPGGQRVVIGFGDWGNRDVAGIIKKSPAGPVKAFERELARYCTVVSIAEYRTSKVTTTALTSLRTSSPSGCAGTAKYARRRFIVYSIARTMTLEV